MEKVKVRIKAGYRGHHHQGREIEPGETIEVTPLQAARLHEIGATEPVKAKKSSSRKKKEVSTESEGPDLNTPKEDTITHAGDADSPTAD